MGDSPAAKGMTSTTPPPRDSASRNCGRPEDRSKEPPARKCSESCRARVRSTRLRERERRVAKRSRT
eukprot:5793849-Alexandrium_andersonii.AAC.1